MTEQAEQTPTEAILAMIAARRLPEPPRPPISQTRDHELELEYGSQTRRGWER